MNGTTKNLAVVFADITESTRLYERLGDVAARSKVAICLDIVVGSVDRHSGRVIKHVGDGVMCTFDLAEQAAVASREMHDLLEKDGNKDTACIDPPLSIRVGMHYGSVLVEQNDIFGDAVNVASRISSMAKDGQILTTKNAVDQLSPVLRATTRYIDCLPLRGRRKHLEIHEILWRDDDVTRVTSANIVQKERACNGTLNLRCHTRKHTIDPMHPTAVLGRSKSCDIPISEMLASRQHLKIECRRGKFYLIDHSTNGTYVRTPEVIEAFLRWEEMPLNGCGQLSLGRPFRDNPSELVHFSFIG